MRSKPNKASLGINMAFLLLSFPHIYTRSTFVGGWYARPVFDKKQQRQIKYNVVNDKDSKYIKQSL